MESAGLLLSAQEEAGELDRTVQVAAIIRFHEDREYLLDCLRLVLSLCTDEACPDNIRDALRLIVATVLGVKDGPARNGSLYAQKCFSEMVRIEAWLVRLAEQMQRTQTLGNSSGPESEEVMKVQQQGLDLQHESLAAIVTYLVKANYTGIEDFHKLLDYMPKMDKWNSLAVHYASILLSFTSQYGSPDGSAGLREGRSIQAKVVGSKDATPWAIPHFQSAFITWWLAEYSGWFFDQSNMSPLQGVDLEAEARVRSEAFDQALHDGALQCTLTICSQIRPKSWCDPAREGLIAFLLRDSSPLPVEVSLVTPYFQDLLMQSLEAFTEAFITNMPDTLRRFKTEEDDQRRILHSGLQGNLQNGAVDHDLHLERFLVLISYAYEHRPDAAQSFWSDPDGNLYGFLQWASKRQSTPRVSAFCEMFRAISEGKECAEAAHQFLLEESSATSGRIRKSSTLSWAQIFGELSFYASQIREHPVTVLPTQSYSTTQKAVEIDEPESAMMLECYLRLISHLCYQSDNIRLWAMTFESFNLLDMLFLLCSSAVPRRIRACAYITINSLLTDKTAELGNHVWTMLDQWASGGFSSISSLPKSVKIGNTPGWAEEITLETIANDFEEANAFVSMLHSLISAPKENDRLHDTLSFPEQLGLSYRMPGVEPYVDFVMGSIFAVRVPQLEDHLQSRILSQNALGFVLASLNTFNENLLIIANKSNVIVDNAMTASSLLSYNCLHPFCRVMEWLFNERVLTVLFSITHQDIAEVNNSPPDSPLVTALMRSIEVMNLIMDLQSTYLNIVRPQVKTKANGRKQPVLTPTLTSFEDSVASNIRVITDLGLYCGSGHQELVLASLKLLGRLSSSRKLNAPQASRLGSRIGGNRLISAIEQNGDAEPIARSMISAMRFDSREFSQGPEASGYRIKLAILDFLDLSLIGSPDTPNLAHALLGFTCAHNTVSVKGSNLFAKGSSLFHAVLCLALDYPEGMDGSVLSWPMDIKQKAIQILETLSRSSMTSAYTLSEMRDANYLFRQTLSQAPLTLNSLWDNRTIRDADFSFELSVVALERYLQQRCSLYSHVTAELRLATLARAPSSQARILSTLLGSTLVSNDDQIANMTVLDMLDFLNLEIPGTLVMPRQQYFSGLDFSVSTTVSPSGSVESYNTTIIAQLLALRLSESHQSMDVSEASAAISEADRIILYYTGKNNLERLEMARMNALNAWVDMVTLMVGNENLEHEVKAMFVLRALQMLTPKLEFYTSRGRSEALCFAKIARALLYQFDFKSTHAASGGANDVVNDRLAQLFGIALQAIPVSDGDHSLREALYDICYRYLANVADVSSAASVHRKESQVIKNVGEKLLDVVCDDAYGGEGTCRIAALLLLEAMVACSKTEKSKYILDSLVRTNFIIVLVESLKDISEELRDADERGQFAHMLYLRDKADYQEMLLSYFLTTSVNYPYFLLSLRADLELQNYPTPASSRQFEPPVSSRSIPT